MQPPSLIPPLESIRAYHALMEWHRSYMVYRNLPQSSNKHNVREWLIGARPLIRACNPPLKLLVNEVIHWSQRTNPPSEFPFLNHLYTDGIGNQ